MKKLFLTLAIILLATTASAWTLSWDDATGEDALKVMYKPYPVGYGTTYDPATGGVLDPAPDNLIEDLSGAVEIMLPADTLELALPDTLIVMARYVFYIQALNQGSVISHSDHFCWTKPTGAGIFEYPLQQGGDIQINIYQAPR
jgi:hypothetical protein